VATTIPAELPMMAADPAAIEAWRRRLAPLPRPWVGLAWAGDPKNGTDRLRSLGADDLAALLALPGISWISLQKGAAAPAGMADPTAALTDFADTAALVANLDLVVSVDTAVAHLAGALAKPVWILLRANGDWRWGLEGETTRWYPTARLFRQSVPGRWEDVVATLADLTKVLFPVPKMTYPRQIDQVQKVRAVARRMNRLGVVDTWTRVLGVVAVLINVFAWALVGIPSASAEDVATLYDAAEICHAAPAHGPADDSQPSHQLCPQCFPLGGHCGAAFVPLATQGTVAVIALGRIATEDPPRLIAAARPFRQRARGPPAQV